MDRATNSLELDEEEPEASLSLSPDPPDVLDARVKTHTQTSNRNQNRPVIGLHRGSCCGSSAVGVGDAPAALFPARVAYVCALFSFVSRDMLKYEGD